MRDQQAPATAQATAEAIARRSYGKLVAYLAARTHDLARAEDALSEAFATALRDWPTTGTPANPEAWLITVARRKLIDQHRHRTTGEAVATTLRILSDELAPDEPTNQLQDERLLLMLACAHPAIAPSIRAPLILQTILGLDAATVASAFLVSPASMAQRLVRAKAKIKQAAIPFHLPDPTDLAPRLDCVLEAIYAAYAQGWRDDAIWLGGLVADLLPNEPEALGLLALMLYSDSRRATRRGADGAYIPLSAQDPANWDTAQIDTAERLLARAGEKRRIGRYQLEAAIQSVHANRRRTGQTDWAAIVPLYDGLFALTQSPVVAINRAVAISVQEGPEAGLRALDQRADSAKLATYQPYWAARAELLARSGDKALADHAYGNAIGLEQDPAIRQFLQQCRAALADQSA